MKTRMFFHIALTAGVGICVAGKASAQHYSRPCPPAPCDCPPGKILQGEPSSQTLTPAPGSAGAPQAANPGADSGASLFAQGDVGGAGGARDRSANIFGNYLGLGSRYYSSSAIVPIYQRQTYTGFNVSQNIDDSFRLNFTNDISQVLVSKQQPDVPTSLPQGTVIGLDKQQPGWIQNPIVKGNATLTSDYLSGQGFADVDITQISGYSRVTIPVPGETGAGLGRFNISDNNSPMPRDRVFLNYNLFSNTSLGGTNIQKFTPGFEKTFFDGNASFELRAPFGSTLASDQFSDAFTNDQNTQFGNLALAFKALVYGSDCWNFSAGLGLTLPTGQDSKVTQLDGTPMLQVKNSSVQMIPFLGALYTPNDNLFIQGFTQLSFGLNGSDVNANLDDVNTLSRIGKINDRTIWSTDLSFGYWVVRDSCSTISGFAPMLEVHYNQALGHADYVDNGDFLVGSFSNKNSNVNMTFATVLELRNNTSITTGLVIPLTGNNQREFDYEFGVLLNYRFGARSTMTSSPAMFGN